MKNFAIITGAYGGLGRALARTYADAGYDLVLVGRKWAELKALEKKLSVICRAIPIEADVSDWLSCQKAYRLIEKEKLHIKVLINNAGISYIKRFDENYDMEQYKKIIATNLNGPVYMSKLFLEVLIKNEGSLINISSVLAYAPVIGRTAYAASKFGLEGFSSVLRAETKNKMRLLMVYPTFIETNIRSEVEGDKTVNEVLTADAVAQSILRAQLKRKEKLYLGRTAKLSYFLYKFWPKLYIRLMCKKVGLIS